MLPHGTKYTKPGIAAYVEYHIDNFVSFKNKKVPNIPFEMNTMVYS